MIREVYDGKVGVIPDLMVIGHYIGNNLTVYRVYVRKTVI